MTAAEEVRELSDRLGLVDHRQDWGISNADAARTGEFIRICRTQPLSKSQQYAMVELVLASMNEALADGPVAPDLGAAFDDFLTLDLHGLSAQVRYWAALADGSEFPIADLLARAASTA